MTLLKNSSPLPALLLAGCAGMGPRESVEGPGNAAARKVHRSGRDPRRLADQRQDRHPSAAGIRQRHAVLAAAPMFDIRLSGPLGRGAARPTGRPDAVSLEVAGQGRFEADSPEALVEAQLGWQLPVSHLLWWVRGLPAPDSRSRLSWTATAARRAWSRTAGR